MDGYAWEYRQKKERIRMEKENVRLTSLSKSAGCAAKLQPDILIRVVEGLPKFQDENLLVGTETADDGAVYKISEDLAMIQTLDFFPPMVDEPYIFGQIAAANALSDVYAMGGEPKLALNILAYPSCLGEENLGEILAGGASKVQEAGAVLAGGHSINDEEPKYGMCVTGFVDPRKIWKNAGARPGDVLLLTKPLGVGLINTAVKAGLASQEAKEAGTMSMCCLNKTAKEVLENFSVHACTDVTGFSLAGHGLEMAKASQVTLVIDTARLPLLPSALEYAAMGLVPEGTYRNKAFQKKDVSLGEGIREDMEDLLFDPQTSGGLLVSLEESQAEQALKAFKDRGLPTKAAIIGRVKEKTDSYLEFV